MEFAEVRPERQLDHEVLSHTRETHLRTLMQTRLSPSEGRPKHTPPNGEHYVDLYLWDSWFAAQTYIEMGRLEEADEEIEAVFEGMREDGFIPNSRVRGGVQTLTRRYFDVDRKQANNHLESSDYSQPTLGAQTVLSLVYAHVERGEDKRAFDIASGFYPKIKQHLEYFEKNRKVDQNRNLYYLIHPHESGRDSDPIFDAGKARLSRNGASTPRSVDYINTVLNYASVVRLGRKAKQVQWDPYEMRGIFCVEDVMFNVLMASDQFALSRLANILGENYGASVFFQRAERTQEAIITEMWDTAAHQGRGTFKNVEHKFNHDLEKPIETTHTEQTSITSLFPVMLPGISSDQLKSVLDFMEESFLENYVLPTVPTNSDAYDPSYQEKSIWRGGVWVWTNRLVTAGLDMQSTRPDISLDLRARCADLAKRIETDTNWITHTDLYEFYHPKTGGGLRKANFSGSLYLGQELESLQIQQHMREVARNNGKDI